MVGASGKEKEPAVGALSLEDANAWERDEGIPAMDEPMLQKYFQGRDALIDQEDKHRSDLSFRELLSPMAREACAIVSQLRYEELQTMWNPAVEDDFAASTGAVYPGMMFTLAKKRIEDTKLWKIMTRMPKGALLHCHLEAMIDQDLIMEEAFATDGICISCLVPLDTSDARATQPFTFRYTKAEQAPDASLWSSDYAPGAWVPLTKAADSFPEGGRSGFKDWFRSRTSITPNEALLHHEGPNVIWAKFQSCFGILRTLIFYEPIYRKFLSSLFSQLMEDFVQYVDVRVAFHFDYRKLGNERAETNKDEMVRVFGEEVRKFQATELGKNFWGARLIWTTIRSFDNHAIFDSMNECIDTKLAYPEIIAGFDLVGHEDPGRPLADIVPLLFWFRKACAEAQVNIPYFFHAGETLGTGTETDHNLFDAILLGTRRIGHGFSLYKHPLLMNMVRDKRILVECCPISNEVLRYTGSISSHPFPALLAQGVPLSLSNDDPALLGQNLAGMSHDFWQALQGIESLGLEGLGSLAENSVRWASFEDSTPREWTEDIKHGAYGQGIRAKRMKEWKSSWERFCQEIVMEYGADLDLDPEE